MNSLTNCSGVLVSPNRVMTARHCTEHLGETKTVFIVTHPGGTKHIEAVTGIVALRYVEDDVAVIDLDHLVTNVPFYDIATADDPCQDTMTATVVGFGLAGDQPPSCGLVTYEDRTYATSNGWTFEPAPNYYKNTWTSTVWPPDINGYRGGLGGDSGGALLRVGDNKLCGIHVKHSGVDCSIAGAIHATSIAAAPQGLLTALGSTGGPLTPEQAILYTDPRTLEPNIKIGTCPPSYFDLDGADTAKAKIDTDGDGMPDLCDTCPTLKNPEQFASVEWDKDEDGIPDKCDSCPSVATPVPPGVNQFLAPLYPGPDVDEDGRVDTCDWCVSTNPIDKVTTSQALADCNLEAELHVYYPTKWEPPLIKLGPSYESELATYKKAFKTGTCDPLGPCPLMERGEGGWPPGQETTKKCVPPGGIGGSCHWYVDNAISYIPKASPATANGLATTHAKWCSCPEGWLDFPTSPYDRVNCQVKYGCLGTSDSFKTTPWLDIQAARVAALGIDWSTKGIAEYVQKFNGVLPGLETWWDYRALGYPYVTDKQSGLPFVEGLGEPLDAFVNGVLWNDTRSGFGIPSGSATEKELQDRGSAFATGHASIGIWFQVPIATPTDPFWDMPVPCWQCPLGVASLTLPPEELLDGSVFQKIVTPAGPTAVAALTPETVSALLATRASGSAKRFIPVSEPLGLLEGSDGTLRGLKGAILDVATGAPLQVLAAPSLFSPAKLEAVHRDIGISSAKAAPLAGDGPGPLSPDEGVVLSGLRNEVYRFGGAAVPQWAWTYSLSYQRWSPRRLDAGGRPGKVVAATYRATDDRIYSADRGATGQAVLLRRWAPGSAAFEQLGQWPAAWSALDRYWLVTSEGGDLLFVGSGKPFSIVVRLVVDDAGKLACSGMRKIMSTIVDRPIASSDAAALTVSSLGSFTQLVVPYSELGSVPKGWCPAKDQ